MNRQSEKRILIDKFLAGEISDSDIESLKAWLAADKENRRIFDKENELWQESQIKTQNECYNTDEAWDSISAKFNLGRRNVSPVVIIKKNFLRYFLAAASVLFLIGLAGIFLLLNQSKKDHENAFASTIVETMEGEKSRIILNDSTIVYMNSSSSIEYTNDYNKAERRVKLTGEAYFDVHTDPGKPFIVQCDKIKVTARGTRFNVQSYTNDNQIEATLEEGIIQVNVSDEEETELKAGQQVVYYRKSNNSITRDVNTETYTSWKENKLRFNDTPFEEVLRKISRRYNVVFEVRNRDLLELSFTATFIDESIEDVMNMLETVSPIKCRIIKRTTTSDRNYLKPKIIVEKK